ncbi:carboxymuconolactone decarboxylase family protein, partial [Vibrio cholerae O1]|nr:carboxymuconolactone decarboxylase family protein [Vibrio cholerae O1]
MASECAYCQSGEYAMTISHDRETLARLAPKLAELSKEVLFDDIWRRKELTPRERSLVTLAALTA